MVLDDGYRLSPQLVESFSHWFEPLTIDRFATKSNAVLPVYNSYFLEEACAGVDAFA